MAHFAPTSVLVDFLPAKMLASSRKFYFYTCVWADTNCGFGLPSTRELASSADFGTSTFTSRTGIIRCFVICTCWILRSYIFWMYVCMHVCSVKRRGDAVHILYVYMYACMQASMQACMHVCMYACMHVCSVRGRGNVVHLFGQFF